MTQKAHAAYGTALMRKNETGVFVAVAELRDISGPSMEKDEIDVTTHDSPDGYREFIGGLKNPGEVEAEINFLFENETHMQAIDDFDSRENVLYRLVFPDAEAIEDRSYFEFHTTLLSFEFTAELEDAIVASLTWKVSGKPELVVGGSGEPSDYEESGTGGTE